jgi:hypothetical protein
MIRRVPYLLALAVLVGPARAQQPTAPVAPVAPPAVDCRVPGYLTERVFNLPQVAKAIKDKHLNVLVVGAGSSALPGPTGVTNSYPVRLQVALSAALPGVEVKVTTDVKSRRSAVEMVKSMTQSIAASKPELVVWQTGTVDAMESVDPDLFSQTLVKGITKARAAGADVVFVNPQYSPRTESMIALGIYAENMRWVALQQEVPLFDRFGIMKIWADTGTFDLYSTTKKLDMAERVHDCIGLLLADLVVEAVKPDGLEKAR